MDVSPLELVEVFMGHENLTSGSEEEPWFWCQRKEVRVILASMKGKVIDQEQFDEVEWRGVHQALYVKYPECFRSGQVNKCWVLQVPMPCKPNIHQIMISGVQAVGFVKRCVNMY